MRGWINDVRSYVPPVGIGELMRALGVGIVTTSRNPRFPVGDHVSGPFGMQEYAIRQRPESRQGRSQGRSPPQVS